MRFFHLSDLHIGKWLHHYNLREDQEAVLGQVIDYARELHPDAIVIAGDIYDRAMPSAEAVSVFDGFLTRLSQIVPKIPILIISGNHDSSERLQYASGILKEQQIYLAGMVPRWEQDRIDKVTLSDAYGEVDFYLLPFLKPSYVRNVFPEQAPETYTEAVERLIEREEIDIKQHRNVLVSHQFYVGRKEAAGEMDMYPETCDSEVFSVGGIDNVNTGAVEGFDYVALGHLHGAQQVGHPKIRYCGTLLKYSVSEAVHHKTLTMVTLGEKGSPVQIEELPLHPLRDVKKKKGTLEEVLRGASEDEREDYVSITLTDETDLYKPKEQLEKVYHRILEIRIDNTRTRAKLQGVGEELVERTPLEAFADFYREIQGQDMEDEEIEVMREILEQVKGE